MWLGTKDGFILLLLMLFYCCIVFVNNFTSVHKLVTTWPCGTVHVQNNFQARQLAMLVKFEVVMP